jgi:hypothetical protein
LGRRGEERTGDRRRVYVTLILSISSYRYFLLFGHTGEGYCFGKRK